MKTSLRLSASLYKKFLICPKQAQFTIDKNIAKSLKTSPTAALGKIAHKIVESSVQNPADWSQDQLIDWFNLKWTELVKSEFDAMQQQWFPNKVISPPTWKGYFKQQVAAKTLVLKRSGLMPPKQGLQIDLIEKSKIRNPKTFPLVEKFLDDPKIRIHGKPDLVLVDDGNLTLIDYKFGQDSMDLSEHKIQMHFYILLIESIFDETVKKCSIVASANKVFDISIDREFLVELKEDIIRVLGALESGKVAAIPKLENCLFCNFKTNCREFSKAKIVNTAGNPLLIYGTVKEIKDISDLQVQIVLITGEADGKKVFEIFGIPKEYEIRVGSKIKVFDYLHFHSETKVEFSWNSQIELSSD